MKNQNATIALSGSRKASFIKENHETIRLSVIGKNEKSEE